MGDDDDATVAVGSERLLNQGLEVSEKWAMFVYKKGEHSGSLILQLPILIEMLS